MDIIGRSFPFTGKVLATERLLNVSGVYWLFSKMKIWNIGSEQWVRKSFGVSEIARKGGVSKVEKKLDAIPRWKDLP